MLPARRSFPGESAADGGYSITAASSKAGIKRGSYSCGRCGQPKKGHICPSAAPPPYLLTPPPPPPLPKTPSNLLSGCIVKKPSLLQRRHILSPPVGRVHDVPQASSRRALDFKGEAVDQEGDDRSRWLLEILRRLPPASLLAASQVCKGWNDCAGKVWRGTEELRISVGRRSIGMLESMLKKCPDLLRLSLRVKWEIDAKVLAYVAFACPYLLELEIRMEENAVNRITGDDLTRFFGETRCLNVLKIEGCVNFGHLTICSTSLVTLWLSDLCSLNRVLLGCANLKELSLEFASVQHDSTDLCIMAESFGRSCPKLRNIHVASVRLSHAFVLSLTSGNLRNLRMLSLVHGSDITDASVAAIASSCNHLELLDLSGSSISDNGIGMICNVFQRSLCQLLLAFCRNITPSGIQFATAQLPLLHLIDCGMVICSHFPAISEKGPQAIGNERANGFSTKAAGIKIPTGQKLIIKHSRLKKLSLWGCSGLESLYLQCPELQDLNINSCVNLHPEGLVLQCPNLAVLNVSKCQKTLILAVENQDFYDFASLNSKFHSKRLADGSKRVQVPHFSIHLPLNDEKGTKNWMKRYRVLVVY